MIPSRCAISDRSNPVVGIAVEIECIGKKAR